MPPMGRHGAISNTYGDENQTSLRLWLVNVKEPTQFESWDVVFTQL